MTSISLGFASPRHTTGLNADAFNYEQQQQDDGDCSISPYYTTSAKDVADGIVNTMGHIAPDGGAYCNPMNVTVMRPGEYRPLGGGQFVTTRQESYAVDPVYHLVDIDASKIEELNEGQTIEERLLDKKSFFMPPPEWNSFYFEKPKEVILHFTLDNESTSLLKFAQDRSENQDPKSIDSGPWKPILMTFSKEELRKAFQLEADVWKHNGFHIIPYLAEIVDVESSFPISLDLSLVNTNAPPPTGRSSSSSYKTDTAFHQNTFNTFKGIVHSNDICVNNNTGSVIGPEATSIPLKMSTLLRASEHVNTADFPRWIAARSDDLLSAVNNARATDSTAPIQLVQIGSMHCYRIILPGALDTINIKPIQWFALAYFSEIYQKTNEMLAPKFDKASLSSSDFDRINEVADFMIPNKGGAVVKVVYLYKDAFLAVMKSKIETYRRSAHAMCLNSLTLSASPLNRSHGWTDLINIAKTREQMGDIHKLNYYARLRVSVRVSYQPFADPAHM